MIIEITINGKVKNYNIEKEEVILGRSKSCDIVVKDDHVSREHLEITKDPAGTIFIRDLTSSNWVSYNEEKLPKDERTNYYDFAPLLLPGNIRVKIATGNQFTSKSRTFSFEMLKDKTKTHISTQMNLKKKNLQLERPIDDLYHNPLVDGKGFSVTELVPHKPKVNAFVKYRKVVVFALLGIMGSYYVLDELSDLKKNPSSSVSNTEPRPQRRVVRRSSETIPKNVEKNKTVDNDTSSSSANEENEEFANLLDTPKCVSGFSKIYCTLFFKNNQAVGEGIIIKGKEFIVLKSRDNRISEILKARTDLINTVRSSSLVDPLLAGEGILLPKVLEDLEKKGIYKVRIFLFKEEGLKRIYLSQYSVDTSYYRRYDTKNYELSYKEFLNSGSASTFDSLLGRVIIKE